MRNYLPYIIIAFALSALMVFVLVLPKYESFNVKKQEIFAKENELKSQEDYFQKIQGISEEIKSYQDSILKIESALPQSRSVPELLNFFQKIASQSGLSMNKVDLAFVASDFEEEVMTTEINLALKGDYSGLKNFLSVAEKSARLIEIEDVSFNYPEKGTAFTFNLRIRVYSY